MAEVELKLVSLESQSRFLSLHGNASLSSTYISQISQHVMWRWFQITYKGVWKYLMSATDHRLTGGVTRAKTINKAKKGKIIIQKNRWALVSLWIFILSVLIFYVISHQDMHKYQLVKKWNRRPLKNHSFNSKSYCLCI